jgi:hypothetical protein
MTKSIVPPTVGDGSAWPTFIPDDCPLPRSSILDGIRFTGRHSNYTKADYWNMSWAADGHLYASCGDGPGIWNAGLYRIEGDSPEALGFTELGNFNIKKGQREGRRYGSCILVKDGVCFYGFEDGWNTSADVGLGRFWGFAHARTYDRVGGDLTELRDDRWRMKADSGWAYPDGLYGAVRPGGFFDEPAGINRIRGPRFVDFGRELEHSPDGFAYMTAHGSECGKPPEWANGDSIFLMRAQPTIEGITRPAGWEFFAGHAATGQPIWRPSSHAARPLITWPDRLGSATVTYVAPLRRYLMCVAPLVLKDNDGPIGKLYSASGLMLLEAERLTGPWRIFQYLGNFGPNAYVMSLPSKFIARDGRTAWLLYSGGWGVPQGVTPNPPHSAYAACLLEINLAFKDQALGERK